MPLSPRQIRVHAFIRGYFSSNRVTPTCAEIAKHFGYSSTATAHRIILILENEGLITRVPLVARGIRLVEQSEAQRAA
jgi:SOS-response transcriptional repressor LexA